ncbi:MAG: gliding motility protein GldM [Hymenobacteraceae bacterium]|nr:gliding motility protein GldM [Hymenobacteraceae bacterium]
MSGGKETPRQKMIGMMYLVLTALLALQVNSAILLKFRTLDEALLGANEKSVRSTQNQIEEMEKKASEAGKATPKDLARLQQGKEVQAKADEVVKYLRELRESIIKRSGGYAEDKVSYANISAEDKVAMEMLGANTAANPGKAKELKARLDGFTAYVKQYVPAVAPLALDAKDDPIAKMDEHQKHKNFAELNFENTPMVAALAVLSEKENAVRRYESEALGNISGLLGKEIIKFDKISTAVSAESKVVAAGTKYKAEMYLTASSSQITPVMTMKGQKVQVKDGKGQIEFTAQAGAYDKDGNSKQKWSGTISIKRDGRDSIFKVEQEYIVAKPVMQVQSASVQALYLNCGNKLNVQVPALGSVYDPSFNATGAQVIKGAEKGEVTLVPTAKDVKLTVSSGGNRIGDQDFKVRLIPKPEMVLTSGGRPIDIKRGVPSPGPREITLAAKPVESFKNFLPEDARYRVTQFEIALVRGRRPVGAPQTVNASSINLNAYAAQAQAGDRYMVEVKTVQRMNFRKQVETVSGIQNTLFNIPLN